MCVSLCQSSLVGACMRVHRRKATAVCRSGHACFNRNKVFATRWWKSSTSSSFSRGDWPLTSNKLDDQGDVAISFISSGSSLINL